MYEDVQVNLCDEIEVKMGNSGSYDFHSKYKIKGYKSSGMF